MTTAERLDCPFCKSALNPGAFVCAACGAARGKRSPSIVAIVVLFPLLGFALGMIALILGASSAAFLSVWFGSSLAMMFGHILARQRVEWVRGADAGGIVVEPTATRAAADEKTCPQCAETVKRAARLCRFCGHQFEGSAGSATVIDAVVVEDGPRRAGGPVPMIAAGRIGAPASPAALRAALAAVAIGVVLGGLFLGAGWVDSRSADSRPVEPVSKANQAIELKRAYDRLTAPGR